MQEITRERLSDGKECRSLDHKLDIAKSNLENQSYEKSVR